MHEGKFNHPARSGQAKAGSARPVAAPLFNPSSHGYRKQELAAYYRKHKREKQMEYGQYRMRLFWSSIPPEVWDKLQPPPTNV